MQLNVEITDSFEQIDSAAYELFVRQSGASLFYDPRFLLAAQRSPLLPVHGSYYLVARDGNRIVGFLPAYLQKIHTVDPLGVLSRTVGLADEGRDLGLFSHIMHCFDSAIPTVAGSTAAYPVLFDALATLAAQTGARYYGFLNVKDDRLLSVARDCGLRVTYLVDRFYCDLDGFRDFDEFVEKLPTDGRQEMNRQLRKFASSGAKAHVLAPPFDDRLEQLAELCHLTTARYGTPEYFPAAPLAQFCRTCGDLVCLIVIEIDGRLVSGLICFEYADTFHLWSAGVVYDRADFSPYTIGFATAYRYAFERKLRRVEAGRLNARIKTRLGLRPCQLHSVTSVGLGPAVSRDAWARQSANCASARFAAPSSQME
jgi:hypothetical protein